MTLATGLRAFWTADPWGVQAPPATPTGLSSTPGNGEVTLSWDATPFATSYTLRSGVNIIYTGSATTFVHTGLTNTTQYSYTVTATNTAGTSAASEPISTAPANPITGLTSTDVVAQLVPLTWTISSSALPVGYTAQAVIVRRNGEAIASLGPTATSYNDMSMPLNGSDTTYTYTVSLRAGDGNSILEEYSTSTSVVTPAVVDPWFVGGNSVYGSATSITVPLPAGIKKWDYIYMTVYRQSTAGASASPTGFTSGYSGAGPGTGFFYNQFYQQVTGTPPTSVAVSFAAAAPTSITVSVWRGADVLAGTFSTTYPPMTFVPALNTVSGTVHTASSQAGVPLQFGPLSPKGTWISTWSVNPASATTTAALGITPADSRLSVVQPGHGTSATVHTIHNAFSSDNIGERGSVGAGFTSSVAVASSILGVWLAAPGSPRPRTQASFQGQFSAATTIATGNSINLHNLDAVFVAVEFAAAAGAVSLTSNNATMNAVGNTLVYDSGASAGVMRTCIFLYAPHNAALTGITFTATIPSSSIRMIAAWNISQAHGMTFDNGATTFSTTAGTPSTSLTVDSNTFQIAFAQLNLGTVTTFPQYVRPVPEWSMGTTGWGLDSLYSTGNIPSGATSGLLHVLRTNSVNAMDQPAQTKTLDNPINVSVPWSQTVVSFKMPRNLPATTPTEVAFAAFGIPL